MSSPPSSPERFSSCWRGGVRDRAVPTAARGTIFDVPTISRFFGIVIAMFFDDHGYPHFHARHAEGAAKVRIDNLEVIERARAGETLREIEPLR